MLTPIEAKQIEQTIPKPITPSKITVEIKAFAKQLVNNGGMPVIRYCHIVKKPQCKPLNCFQNVELVIGKHGGTRVLGHTIWLTPYWITSEFHAVWLDKSNKLQDVTPDTDMERKRLFVIDENATYDGTSLPKQYFVMDKRVQPYIDLQIKLGLIHSQYLGGTHFSKEDTARIFRLTLSSLATWKQINHQLK